MLRKLTDEEVLDFGVDPKPIQWGVDFGDGPLLCFRAETLDDEIFYVHVDAARGFHPELTKMNVADMCEKLFLLGAKEVRANIPRANRAAVKLAKSLGTVLWDDGVNIEIKYGKRT